MKKNKGKSKFSLIAIIVGLLLVAGLIFVPRFLTKSSAPDSSGIMTYKSQEFGFSVKYPKGWVVNDENFAQKQEIIVAEIDQNAFVKINAYQDSSINSEITVRDAMQKFVQEMKSDPNVTVSDSQIGFEGEIGGHMISGQQTIDDEKYQFHNRGLISTDGRILFFHGVVKQSVANQAYQDAIITIIESFALE